MYVCVCVCVWQRFLGRKRKKSDGDLILAHFTNVYLTYTHSFGGQALIQFFPASSKENVDGKR